MAGQMRILMDVVEPRPSKGRLAVGADGSSWDYKMSSNVWIDPCTSSVMLKPLPLTPAWKTTFTGNYARFGIADFTGTDISKWEQYSIDKSASNKALSMKSTTTNPINLTTALPRNCPMYLKYYRNTTQDSTDDPFLVVGYNVGAGGSAPDNFSVQLKFRENGSISVFKNGVFEQEYDRSGNNFSSQRAYTSIFNPSQKYVNVLIIPMRGRDLLVWTDAGTCFVHTFAGLDYPNNPDTNPILPACPAGTFSITVPQGKTSVQVARCYFEQNGYIMSQIKTFRYPPTVTDWGTGPQFQYYHEYFGQGASFPSVSATVQNSTGTGAFVANGTNNQARLKVSFTGASGGTNSTLFAGDAWIDPPYSATFAGNIDITTAVSSLTLNVDESGRTGLQMTCRHKRLVDLGIQKPLITSDRPIAVQIKSDYLIAGLPHWYDIFRGTLSPPEITYEPGKDQTSLNWAILNFTGEDRFLDFNLGQCQEAIPLDYDTINEVFYNLMPMTGYDPTIYFDGEHISTFRTNWHPDMPRGEYTLVPKRSDTPGGIMQNFRDTYLSNWIMCWRPSPDIVPIGGYKFFLIDPSYYTSPQTPPLYQSSYDATTFGGLSTQEASKQTIRALKRYYEKPEANQVVVIGADPSKNSLISGYYIDGASQDPTTAPASRPNNWRGRPVPYILVEPSLTTQTSVNQSANVLASRIASGRHLVEFESDLLMYENPTPVKATFYGQSSAVADGINPTINGTNTFYANQEVVFDTNIGSNIVVGTSYYIRTGVTSTTFQVSATLGGAAITPNAYGTANVRAPWILAVNTFTANQPITLKQTVGNFVAGTTYYVKSPTPSGFYLSATSGPGATQYPTLSGTSRINTGLSKLSVVWLGDTVLVKNGWDGVSVTGPTDLGTFRIVSIPQITFVQESANDTSFKVRSCVYKAVQVS